MAAIGATLDPIPLQIRAPAGPMKASDLIGYHRRIFFIKDREIEIRVPRASEYFRENEDTSCRGRGLHMRIRGGHVTQQHFK